MTERIRSDDATPPTAQASTGLTSARAATLLAEVGPNVLPQVAAVPPWRQLARQFVHFFALLLWAAAGLALIGGMPQLCVAICLVVVVNGLFAFVQEYRAERAAERLRDLLPVRARVMRDGIVTVVDAAAVVPGDVVLLTEGDRVTADMACQDATGLLVDTSLLTGESVPDSVAPGDGLAAGSFVVEGRGTAVVTHTGGSTRFAQIAHLTQSQRRPHTPLELDIRRLVRTVALVAVSVGVVFFLLMLVLGVPASDGFIFGVGVTVALVPEGLLPTVTLSLAIGAQRMAAERALVRHLESVETLGATTVICTDKTGTLTQNRMNIVAAWTPAGSSTLRGEGYEPQATVESESDEARSELAAAAVAARQCSHGGARLVGDEWVAHGDPMDAAVDALVRRLGLAEPAADEIAALPFDPRRRMTASVRPSGLVCKGAPESVMATCDGVPEAAESELHALTQRGLRVLAVASGPVPAGDLYQLPERGLRLLGLLAFEDPPRPGVTEAIRDCRRAGISLAMITGDHPRTARAIAAEIGLALPDSPVALGGDLPAEDGALGDLADHDGIVLARISPEDKPRIARCLQARGHIVAMTGDGVNDAPALREADIGIAMGEGGTDVAREAADLVLLDDHFSTIVSAVRQGRGTFLNTRRFLTYHLTDNVAELAPFLVWAASGGAFPLALGVLQILALDLGTDTLPAIALGADRPSERVLDHPPVRGRLLDRVVATRAFGVLGPAQAVMELVVFVLAMAAWGWRPGVDFPTGPALAAASGGAFLTVVVMQMANSFACRSTTHAVWRLGWLSNRFLLVAIAGTLVFAAFCLLVPPVAGALGQAWPPVEVLPVIAASAVVLWVADAAWKVRHRATHQGPRARSPEPVASRPAP